MSNYDFEDIKQSALGQWHEILAAFGIPFRAKQKAGTCPRCGGNDRSHYKQTSGKVFLFCRHCGTHWADELLLELCFGNDFYRMCKELGDYLHCQPSERKEYNRTQAKVAEASNTDIDQVKHKIREAYEFAKGIEKTNMHPILLRYGVGADCLTHHSIEGAFFPLKIKGQIVDWLVLDDAGQSILSGDIVKSAKLVIKPDTEPRDKIFVTPDIVDAYYLFNTSKRQNIVVCCGTLKNMGAVCDSLPDKYKIITAIENTPDAINEQTYLKYDFIMPDDPGRKFCDIDYKYKPTKIYKAAQSYELLNELEKAS